ncbi:MAG: (2Fe-2S)-binding protein [Actinomycetia bacterium]|nr:(2Fe-2S)-binding protein [Actinomycetes bacterium]
MSGTDLESMLVQPNAFLPAARYTSPEFLELELEHLFGKVWQMAGREEQIPAPGDFLEYQIGDESVIIVRSESGGLDAFPNVCLHRGTQLAHGCGHFDGNSIRCPYHSWTYSIDGTLRFVPDREEFPDLPDDLALQHVQVDSWGGFIFVNLDRDAKPLLEMLEPLPTLLAAYHLEELKFRSYLSTVIHANWKTVVDAFNEAYHVQGLHQQILAWTDDVAIAYEQFPLGHAHYGQIGAARGILRPSPRLGLDPSEYDEGELLFSRVNALGGAFMGAERDAVQALRDEGPPEGQTLLEAYQHYRLGVLNGRGFDTSGLEPAQMTSVEDTFVFPNVVGPLFPGTALMFRVRPNGHDPNSCLKDTWVLEWPDPGSDWKMPKIRDYPNWHDRDWGEVTEQDYNNLGNVQAGMRSKACEGLRLNPRQEGNVLRMHEVVDEYITKGLANS